MAHYMRLIILSVAIAAVIATAKAQTKPKPTALLLPITKDPTTKQYHTTFDIGTSPRTPLDLLLDLSSELTWFDCSKTNSSSTFRSVSCRSALCKSIPGSACDARRTCAKTQYDPLGNSTVNGLVSFDRASFHSTDGARVSARRFVFLCSAGAKPSSSAAAGVLGLARGSKPFATQLSSAFNIPPKFSLCLPSYGTGRFYVGGGPSISSPSTLTPLASDPSNNYFISVKSIAIDGTPVLSLDNKGNGGTKICTLAPYTVLRTDVYKALADMFVKRAAVRGIQTAATEAPFGVCFNTSTVGKNAPVIDLVVPGRMGDGAWRLYGSNSLVRATKTKTCWAFLDGGAELKASVVIGGYQLENHLVEFDLTRSVLGISSSLLLQNTTCSTFATPR